MLTGQETARIRAKIRKEQYCITLDQMKRYFKQHQHAREIDDKKTMEKSSIISLTSIFITNASCLYPGSMANSRRSSETGESIYGKRKEQHEYG